MAVLLNVACGNSILIKVCEDQSISAQPPFTSISSTRGVGEACCVIFMVTIQSVMLESTAWMSLNSLIFPQLDRWLCQHCADHVLPVRRGYLVV